MSALYWVGWFLSLAFGIVCWQLAERNARALESSKRLTGILSESLTLSQEAHANDNRMHQAREEAVRRLMVRVASLLNSALAARDYGDSRIIWENHWRDIEVALSLTSVFPSRD